MKKYMTIRIEETEAKHLEKWIQKSLKLAELIQPEDRDNEWFKKILKIVKNRKEDNLPL